MTEAQKANVERMHAGLPQIATKTLAKPKSLADVFKSVVGAAAPAPKAGGKKPIVPATNGMIRKVCPELVDGLLNPDGSHRPNTLVDLEDGTTGIKGTLTIHRVVIVNKALAKFILDRFGKANRIRTKSKVADYTAHMDVGIGGNSKEKGWNYVGNTAIFTVDQAGNVSGADLEQHNAGHTLTSLLDAADPNACIKMLFIFGIPKCLRDNIDKNVARSPKDIASTRVELKERFYAGAIIGGQVKLTEAMATSCIGEVSQVLRIVKSIREGGVAKDSGAGNIEMEHFDLYADPIAQAIEMIYGLDHILPTTTVSARTGKETKKTGGGLKRRYAMNHLASVMVLAAAYKRPDGTIGLDADTALSVLGAYRVLGDETETDRTEPMVTLRNQIDEWDASKKHTGTDGKNVRWNVLKMSLLQQLAGQKIANPKWLVNATSKFGDSERLNGLGFHAVDETDVEHLNGEELVQPNEIVCGIDDFVDPAIAAMEAAGQAPSDDDQVEELIDDEDMNEQSSDVPEDDEVEELDE